MVRGFRFGVFDLDATTGELRKHGIRVRLARQSTEILRLLAEHPGELVSRDEIRRRLWPAGEVVEYEHSINTAVARLRETLGESATAPRMLETVAGRGYRLLIPVEIIGDAVTRPAEMTADARSTERTSSAPAAPPEAASASTTPRSISSQPSGNLDATRSDRYRLVLSVAGVITVALALAAMAGKLGMPWGTASSRVQSIVVLPFLDLSDARSHGQLAEWMTERLIADLARLNRFLVTSHTTAMSYRGTSKTVPAIGRELGADAVLEGSVQMAAGTVRATARLVDARTDRPLWSASFERSSGEVMLVQADIARAIVTGLRIALTPAEMAAVPPRVKPEALEAYLKGRYSFDLDRAGDMGVSHLREAVRLDPGFALAWATLATRALAVLTADDLPLSEEVLFAARKAVELDDQLAEAHVVAGDIEFFANWNWARGEAEYRRAVELNPSSGEAQMHFGGAMWMLGRTDAALQAFRRTAELAPEGRVATSGYAHWLRVAGRTSDALLQVRRSLQLAPDYAQNYAILSRIHEDLGQDQAAFEALLKAATLNGASAETIEARKETYRVAGLAGVRRQFVEERLKTLQARAAHARVSPIAFAQTYAELGDKAEAFRWLEKAFAARSLRMPWVAMDVSYNSLRSEPEYQALLVRMGLR